MCTDLERIDIINGYRHASEQLAKNSQSRNTQTRRTGGWDNNGTAGQRRALNTRQSSSGVNFDHYQKLRKFWKVSVQLYLCNLKSLRFGTYNNTFSRPLSYEKRKVKEQAKKPPPPPPKPNSRIIDALYKALNLSFFVSRFLAHISS